MFVEDATRLRHKVKKGVSIDNLKFEIKDAVAKCKAARAAAARARQTQQYYYGGNSAPRRPPLYHFPGYRPPH